MRLVTCDPDPAVLARFGELELRTSAPDDRPWCKLMLFGRDVDSEPPALYFAGTSDTSLAVGLLAKIFSIADRAIHPANPEKDLDALCQILEDMDAAVVTGPGGEYRYPWPGGVK